MVLPTERVKAEDSILGGSPSPQALGLLETFPFPLDWQSSATPQAAGDEYYQGRATNGGLLTARAVLRVRSASP